MYAMDMRQYDPAIARWTVQDPIIHHDFSPYNAFDNNPVFWADPSGGNSSSMMGLDQNGRERYDEYGAFIPEHQRGARAGTALGDAISSNDGSTSYLGGGWIKNKETAEVKWFDGTEQQAINEANKFWGFFDSRGKTACLGSSYFGTKGETMFDDDKIKKQQLEYLRLCARKIDMMSGAVQSSVTFEFLSSSFFGTPFGNSPKSSGWRDVAGVAWDYGGSDYVTKKLPYTLVKGAVYTMEVYGSALSAGAGSDKASHERAKAVQYFKTNTMNYITPATLYMISIHKF